MKKFLSYLFPITKTIPTRFNGLMELTYYNGKKILNSANANYSYDTLQRILKFGLTKIELNKVREVLLLGLGGGSVIQTLREDFNFRGTITAVELDPAIIEIAAKEFQIVPGGNLIIVNADAYEFVKNSVNHYDLIIIDLFIDTLVPDKFYTNTFWNNISGLIRNKGYFIFNASVKLNKNLPLAPFIEEIGKSFVVQHYDAVEGMNTLIIGQKIGG